MTAAAGRIRRKPGAGHRSMGGGYRPAQGPGNGSPGKPLDITPEKQRARGVKSGERRRFYRDHPGHPDTRLHRLKMLRMELVRMKRAIRARNEPPRVRSDGGEQ
jgi:hypothetical protein